MITTQFILHQELNISVTVCSRNICCYVFASNKLVQHMVVQCPAHRFDLYPTIAAKNRQIQSVDQAENIPVNRTEMNIRVGDLTHGKFPSKNDSRTV